MEPDGVPPISDVIGGAPHAAGTMAACGIAAAIPARNLRYSSMPAIGLSRLTLYGGYRITSNIDNCSPAGSSVSTSSAVVPQTDITHIWRLVDIGSTGYAISWTASGDERVGLLVISLAPCSLRRPSALQVITSHPAEANATMGAPCHDVLREVVSG